MDNTRIPYSVIRKNEKGISMYTDIEYMSMVTKST